MKKFILFLAILLMIYPVKALDVDTSNEDLNILVIEINPTLKTITNGNYSYNNDHPRVSDLLQGIDAPKIAINEMIEDIEDSSYGYIKVKTKWEYLDEFPRYKKAIKVNGVEGYSLTEKDYLEAIKYNGDGNYNKDYFFNLINSDLFKVPEAYSFDYEYLIKKFDLINRRNKGEFDQVWLITIDPASTYETLMVGKNAYWINGTPIEKDCNNFVLANVSISRRDANYHAFGHGIEGIMRKAFGVDKNDYTKDLYNISTIEEYNKLSLWEKFALNSYNNKSSFITGVGNVHFPFNGEKDYDYTNTNKVNSNWEEWINYPSINGKTKTYNNEAWKAYDFNNKILSSSTENKADDRLYMRFMTSLFPHFKGRTEDGYSHNWWTYIRSLDFVTKISSETKTIEVKEREQANIPYELTYNSGKVEKLNTMYKSDNTIIGDDSIIDIVDDKIVGLKEGNTTLKISVDGNSIEYTVNVLKNEVYSETVIDENKDKDKDKDKDNNIIDSNTIVLGVIVVLVIIIIILIIVSKKKKNVDNYSNNNYDDSYDNNYDNSYDNNYDNNNNNYDDGYNDNYDDNDDNNNY